MRIARALADATRFGILRAITEAGEISCGDLAAKFPIAQPTVSHHVKVLVDCGLVNARKDGQHSIFSAQPAALDAYRGALGHLGALAP